LQACSPSSPGCSACNTAPAGANKPILLFHLSRRVHNLRLCCTSWRGIWLGDDISSLAAFAGTAFVYTRLARTLPAHAAARRSWEGSLYLNTSQTLPFWTAGGWALLAWRMPDERGISARFSCWRAAISCYIQDGRLHLYDCTHSGFLSAFLFLFWCLHAAVQRHFTHAGSAFTSAGGLALWLGRRPLASHQACGFAACCHPLNGRGRRHNCRPAAPRCS